MRRFTEEIRIMERRKRSADALHRLGVGVLFTGKERSLGGWRKSRPHDSCSPSQGCIACEIERSWKAREAKRERLAGKRAARSAEIE